MKTWVIAASAFGGIFASDIIRLSAVILKKNMGTDSMTEYIEREAAIRALLNDATEQVGYSREDAADCIHYIDAADVAPVRHGRWGTNSDRPDSLICSVCNCGFDMWKHDPHNYCPHCGAKMDGE